MSLSYWNHKLLKANREKIIIYTRGHDVEANYLKNIKKSLEIFLLFPNLSFEFQLNLSFTVVRPNKYDEALKLIIARFVNLRNGYTSSAQKL